MTHIQDPGIEDVRNWWATSVIRAEPGIIEYRGEPIQNLIDKPSFVETMWLLVTGRTLLPEQRPLLEAALLAAADHGPQAPSIASARMAITCGVGLNSAMANGVNTLGDTHGGAGQQCVALLRDMTGKVSLGNDVDQIASEIVTEYKSTGAFVPGFGHRFHPRDPRRDPLITLVEHAARDGAVKGEALACGLALESALAHGRKNPVPMNIDGATAIIYAELGCEPELARGFFVLSRSVGILAHAWEERQTGRRIKGPIPPPLTAPYVHPSAS